MEFLNLFLTNHQKSKLEFFINQLHIRFSCRLILANHLNEFIVQQQMNTQSYILQQSLIQQTSRNPLDTIDEEIPNVPEKSLLSNIFFSYVYPFLSDANKNGTTIHILPFLTQNDKIQSNFYKLISELKNRHSEQCDKDDKSLIKIIFKIFKWNFLKIMLLVFAVSALKMYTPFLCAQIIQYVSQRQTRQQWEGFILLTVVILVTFFRTLAETQMNYQLSILGVDLSSNISLLIYNKSLRIPLLLQKKFSSSDIINYSQVDSERLTYFGNQISSLLSTPIQLAIGIVLMWFFIGISFLAGLITTVIMIWIIFVVSKYTIEYSSEILQAKDNRMKATQEMLENIRFIKINALQSHFLDKINKQREIQLTIYKKKAWCEAFGQFLYWLTGPMILFTTFTTYILIGNEMTSKAAFTTIMIFSLLQYPIRQLPTAVSEVLQMFTSLKRIQNFLNTKQINADHVFIQQLPYQQHSISINYGNFKWKQESDVTNQKQETYSKVLKNINVDFKRNKLTMIVGQIGSGKSSLLLAILNEMKSKRHTQIKINGKIAYCSQTPWILSNTVRNNIILFNECNEYKFQKVIYYSGLQNELKIFPRGDLTQIGQKGMNISGGQKARISLARALYGNYDIYLFDDILSAVDVHMADFLMRETIKTFLKEKTVIFVTNLLKYAKLADEVVIMKKGNIILQQASDNALMSKQFNSLKKKQKLQKQQTVVKIQQKTLEELRLIKLAVISKQKNSQKENANIVEQLMLPEQQQIGKIKMQVFQHYINYNGGLLKFASFVILAMIFWIVSTTFASIFMSMWCQNPKQYDNGLIIYVSLSLSSSIFILIRASILILSGVRQGRIVHKLMINSLFKASLINFYYRIPIGRIINRLTKYLRQLDQAMGPAIGGLLVCFFQMLGTIAICIYTSTPYLLIPTIVLLYCCWKIKNYYLNAQRQVTRLQRLSNTPIVNDFVSTLRGLESVRAYKLSEQFLKDQIKHINHNKRIRVFKQGLQSWFALNLTYLSFLVNILAIGYCILNDSTSPAIAGLLITYALNLSSDINLTILCYAQFQTKAISLERIYEFTQIEPQQGNQNSSDLKIQGKISFIKACVRYRKDLPNILENVTLNINRGQKIGIVGKYGSGKTSIINALLRIAEVSSGKLLIDEIQIKQIPLQALRKSITIIDQQAIILKGTIKQNIDIYNEFTEAEVTFMLKQCDMLEKIQKKGGLAHQISKETLSSGEKQLICICRALIRQSPIILIDEATASIDEKNDENIQEVIKKNFKQSTVLTIAYHLQTLNYCDKILILEKGQVVQFGTPTQLRKLGGNYYQMIKMNTLSI